MRKIKSTLYPCDTFNLINLYSKRDALERELDSCRWENSSYVDEWEEITADIERIEKDYGVEYY